MRNGIVIRRGIEYLARKTKKVRTDGAGFCWSPDIQKARAFKDHGSSCRTARITGGIVRQMTDGKVSE